MSLLGVKGTDAVAPDPSTMGEAMMFPLVPSPTDFGDLPITSRTVND